jgi:hypothetical protein
VAFGRKTLPLRKGSRHDKIALFYILVRVYVGPDVERVEVRIHSQAIGDTCPGEVYQPWLPGKR